MTSARRGTGDGPEPGSRRYQPRTFRLGWAAVVLVAALVGVLATLGVQAVTRSGEIEVRINAYRQSDGDVLFALQQREADGTWAERRTPRAHLLPARNVERWANSSSLTVTWSVESEPEETVVAVVTQIEEIAGVEVEIDRLMEVNTVTVAPPVSGSSGDGTLEDGGAVGRYSAFCSNSRYRGNLHRYENGRALSSALWASRGREITAAEWAHLIELELDVWTAVTPPPSFSLFHSAMVTGLHSVLRAAEERDPASVVLTMGTRPSVFLTGEQRLTWVSALPADVIRLVKHQNCLAVPEPEERLMGG